jgi:hypothetical protein
LGLAANVGVPTNSTSENKQANTSVCFRSGMREIPRKS